MTNFSHNFLKQAKYGQLLLAQTIEPTNLLATVRYDSNVYAYEIAPEQKAEFETWAKESFETSDTQIDNIIYSQPGLVEVA